MRMLIADLSHWNIISPEFFTTVDGVILKLGQGFKVDSKFIEYYNKAKERGCKVGCYYFSTAKNRQEVEVESTHFINMLRGYKFELPIYADCETQTYEELQEVVNEWERIMRMIPQCYFGIYSNFDRLTRINTSLTTWCAKYTNNTLEFDLNQFTSMGHNPYASSGIDLNIASEYFNQIVELIAKDERWNKFEK